MKFLTITTMLALSAMASMSTDAQACVTYHSPSGTYTVDTSGHYKQHCVQICKDETYTVNNQGHYRQNASKNKQMKPFEWEVGIKDRQKK